MRKSSSSYEQTNRHQFDRVCQMAMKGEVANYYREMEIRKKHEVTFSDVSKKELDSHFVLDEYDVEVRDALIAEALEALSEKKREIILMSFFLDMKDAEIARQLNLVQSARKRKRRLGISGVSLTSYMKKLMKGEETCRS